VVSDNPITGKVVLCTGWATDLEQHAIFLDWHSPNVGNAKEQTESIAHDCLHVAIAAAYYTTPIELTLSVIEDNLAALKTAFKVCIKGQEKLGRLFVSDYDIRVRQQNFWQ